MPVRCCIESLNQVSQVSNSIYTVKIPVGGFSHSRDKQVLQTWAVLAADTWKINRQELLFVIVSVKPELKEHIVLVDAVVVSLKSFMPLNH